MCRGKSVVVKLSGSLLLKISTAHSSPSINKSFPRFTASSSVPKPSNLSNS